jgi:hypothetical protein
MTKPEASKVVNEVPLTEIIPKGFIAVRKGKRNMSWRADKPATLAYAETLDGGDPASKVEFRDEVFFGTHHLMAATSLVKNTTTTGE